MRDCAWCGSYRISHKLQGEILQGYIRRTGDDDAEESRRRKRLSREIRRRFDSGEEVVIKEVNIKMLLGDEPTPHR